MAKKWYIAEISLFRLNVAIALAAVLFLLAVSEPICASESHAGPAAGGPPAGPWPQTELNRQQIPYKILYETYRKTNGTENWELYIVNADGSNPVNLTRTPDVDEMYPHASADGSKICFVADELVGEGPRPAGTQKKVRNVYYMNIDGTNRVKVAENAREQCWSADGKTIAYLKGEFQRYTITDYATRGLFFYDLATGKHREHPNKGLHHLYNICWSPDGDWFVATVHGGMGFKHAILAIEANAAKVFDLTKFGVTGCRPDFSGDGKRITWGATDWDLCVSDIDFAGEPTVTNVRRVVKCQKDCEVYHSDFSPDGKYIAFSHGPTADEMIGGKAPGWDICIADIGGADASQPVKWVEVTTDGNHNKEPDWVPQR